MKKAKIPKRLRKLQNRSGTKPCDICNEPHILVEHHIRGRKIPNPNHTSNICNCCDNCHRLIHEGIIIIEGWMSTTNGTELIYHKNDEKSLTGNDAKPHLISHNNEPMKSAISPQTSANEI